MSFFVPSRVRDTATGFGAEGDLWLETLPARVEELERAWSLTAQQAPAARILRAAIDA
jgi:hypothetical protein